MAEQINPIDNSPILRPGFGLIDGKIRVLSPINPYRAARELLGGSEYSSRHGLLAEHLFIFVAALIFPDIPESELARLGSYAGLHDLGKSALLPIVIKRDLNPLERGLLHQHPEVAAKLLSGWPNVPPDLFTMTTLHHERQNGEGYPKGLKAGDIPWQASMMAVVDVLVTVTAPRPWENKVLTFSDGLGTIDEEASRGRQHGQTVAILIKALPSLQDGSIVDRFADNPTVLRSLYTLAPIYNWPTPPLSTT